MSFTCPLVKCPQVLLLQISAQPITSNAQRIPLISALLSETLGQLSKNRCYLKLRKQQLPSIIKLAMLSQCIFVFYETMQSIQSGHNGTF